jgi:hypothetical protein
MAYDNTNSGAIFVNDRKTKDSQPDYTGLLNAGGVDWRVSAWVKVGAKGKFLSIAVSPKDENAQSTKPASSFLDDVKTDPKAAEHLASRPNTDFDTNDPF